MHGAGHFLKLIFAFKLRAKAHFPHYCCCLTHRKDCTLNGSPKMPQMTLEAAPCAWHNNAASVAMTRLRHTSELLSWQWHFGGESNEQPPAPVGGVIISLKWGGLPVLGHHGAFHIPKQVPLSTMLQAGLCHAINGLLQTSKCCKGVFSRGFPGHRQPFLHAALETG